MSENHITTQQQHVLTLLAQGSTVSAAAEAVGVHRNTVSNWRRRGSPLFRRCWQAARLEQAEYWRDEMQSLGDLAVQALHFVLSDGKTSASVRLKAALAVLNTLATPIAQPAEAPHISAQPIDPVANDAETAAACASATPAQECTIVAPDFPAEPVTPSPEELHQSHPIAYSEMCPRPSSSSRNNPEPSGASSPTSAPA